MKISELGVTQIKAYAADREHKKNCIVSLLFD
jgi:hypothetical protein